MKKKLGNILYKRMPSGKRIKKPLWAVILDKGKILLYFKEYDTDFTRRYKVMFESAGFRCKFKWYRPRFNKSRIGNPTYFTVWARFQKREECEKFIEELNAGNSFQVIYSMGFSMDELFANGILEMLGED